MNGGGIPMWNAWVRCLANNVEYRSSLFWLPILIPQRSNYSKEEKDACWKGWNYGFLKGWKLTKLAENVKGAFPSTPPLPPGGQASPTPSSWGKVAKVQWSSKKEQDCIHDTNLLVECSLCTHARVASGTHFSMLHTLLIMQRLCVLAPLEKEVNLTPGGLGGWEPNENFSQFHQPLPLKKPLRSAYLSRL